MDEEANERDEASVCCDLGNANSLKQSKLSAPITRTNWQDTLRGLNREELLQLLLSHILQTVVWVTNG